MKPRVTGRIRHVYAMDTYVVEMRPEGLTVWQRYHRKRYLVPFDQVIVLVRTWIDRDAALKRDERREKIAGIRRARREKNQLPLPIV